MTSRFLVSFVFVSLAACGGRVNAEPPVETDTGAPPDTAPIEDAIPPEPDAAPPPLDHGKPSDTYPAFTPDLAQLVDKGGGPLTNPIVVTVTYPGDVNADSYEKFGDKIGTSDYWKQITAEYGVAPATSGTTNHVRNTDALPAAMTDAEVDGYVADHVENFTKYGWPAATDQSIYVLYIPKTTAISLRGSEACASGVGGYHSVTSASGMSVAYAIVLQCSFGSKSGTPRTVTASHEIAEAALDPHPTFGEQGFADVDKNHLAWHIFMAGNTENGDLCEIYRESRLSTTEPDFAFNVQRQWSNVSGKAGHNPCVPVPTTAPYYNVVALDQEDVTFNAVSIGYTSRQATKGYHVNVGETKTFPIGFYSDAKTGPITLKVGEGSAFSSGTTTTKRLTSKIDKTTGVNGEKAYVTVTVDSIPLQKATVLVVQSSDGLTQHYLPILISSQ